MAAYLPLLIQTSKSAGAFSSSLEYNPVFDTLERFGLYIKHSPFTLRPKPKNIISQTWKDQNGDDEYIPSVITHEPYEMELEFVYYRNDGMANVNIQTFIDTIEGKWLKIYDSYTQIGRQAIRMIECDEDPTFKRRGLNDFAQFKIKFKVNDPDTDVSL